MRRLTKNIIGNIDFKNSHYISFANNLFYFTFDTDDIKRMHINPCLHDVFHVRNHISIPFDRVFCSVSRFENC